MYPAISRLTASFFLDIQVKQAHQLERGLCHSPGLGPSSHQTSSSCSALTPSPELSQDQHRLCRKCSQCTGHSNPPFPPSVQGDSLCVTQRPADSSHITVLLRNRPCQSPAHRSLRAECHSPQPDEKNADTGRNLRKACERP